MIRPAGGEVKEGSSPYNRLHVIPFKKEFLQDCRKPSRLGWSDVRRSPEGSVQPSWTTDRMSNLARSRPDRQRLPGRRQITRCRGISID